VQILYVTLRVPFPPTSGHRLRVWLLLRALAAEQHDVTLISLADAQETETDLSPLRGLCSSVSLVPRAHTSYESRDYGKLMAALLSPRPYQVLEVLSPPLVARVKELAACQHFDLVICDQIVMVANLPPGLSIPVVVDSVHVAHELLDRYLDHMRNPLKRLYLWIEYLKMRPWEARVCSESSAVLACSDLERRVFQRLSPGARVFTAPNVVDLSEYTPTSGGDDATLLFSGTMEWYPNQNAVEFFASGILPELRRLRPGVRLRVAGRGGAESFRRRFRGQPEIEFTGFVSDMRDEIAGAAVCVVPLRIGSGTRLKILEAAAMAKPVVSTRLGVEGLDFEEGEEILLADDPRDFARAVAGLLADPDRRRQMGQAARRRVEAQYGVPALRESLRQILANLRPGSAPGRPSEVADATAAKEKLTAES
jgi:glycosyltransferase involved in cell wall biosynthesis